MDAGGPQSISQIFSLTHQGGFEHSLVVAGDTFPSAIVTLFNFGDVRAAEVLHAAMELAFGDKIPASIQNRKAAISALGDVAYDALLALTDELTSMDDPSGALIPDLPPIPLTADDAALSSSFVEMTNEWVALGLSNVPKANKIMARLHEIAVLLRSSTTGRHALRSLLLHPSAHIRLSAANECLFWDDIDAIEELDRLEADGGDASFSARWILIDYRAGTRKRW